MTAQSSVPTTDKTLKQRSRLAGELEPCLGPAAFRVSNKIRTRRASRRHYSALVVSRVNRFGGGPPIIDTFTANCGHDLVSEPGDRDVTAMERAQRAGPSAYFARVCRIPPSGAAAPDWKASHDSADGGPTARAGGVVKVALGTLSAMPMCALWATQA